jgi:hypothetical protein
LLGLILLGTAPARCQFVSDPARLTQGRWEATPCVERFQAVPGSPGNFFLRLHKIGPRRRGTIREGFTGPRISPDSCAATRDGMVVFWAGTGPKKDRPDSYDISELAARLGAKQEWYSWTLFSYKDGQLVRIASEDAPVALPDLKEAYLRRNSAEILPFRDHVLLFYDNNKMLSLVNGFAVWNGKEFRTLLQLEKPAVLGGENHLLRGIGDWGQTGAGDLWLQLSSKNERGGQFLYAVYDGAKIETRLSMKDKWPGTKFDAKPAYTTPVARERLNIFANGMLVRSTGGEFGGALLWVQKDRTEVLVKPSGLNDAIGIKIGHASEILCASGVDQFLFKGAGKDSIFGEWKEVLVHFRQGKLERIFDTGTMDQEKGKPLNIFQGVAMEGANPQFFFTAGPTWQEDTGVSSVKRVVSQPRLYWFDGQVVRSVAKDIMVGSDSLKITESPLGKLLWVDCKPYVRLVVSESGAGKKIESDAPWQRQVITVSAAGAALQDPPRFSLTNSKVSFSLADVVGWTSEKEALVLAEPGLYRLKRVE